MRIDRAFIARHRTWTSGEQGQVHLFRCNSLKCILAKEGLTAASHAENQCVGNIAAMHTQKVGRVVVSFDHCQALRSQNRICTSRQVGS
jgi:hypothetical protein